MEIENKNHKDINQDLLKENNELLKNLLILSEENNSLILKVRKYQKWNNTFKFIYWTIIILAALGLFASTKNSDIGDVKNVKKFWNIFKSEEKKIDIKIN